jgi:hypothetical protein
LFQKLIIDAIQLAGKYFDNLTSHCRILKLLSIWVWLLDVFKIYQNLRRYHFSPCNITKKYRDKSLGTVSNTFFNPSKCIREYINCPIFQILLQKQVNVYKHKHLFTHWKQNIKFGET